MKRKLIGMLTLFMALVVHFSYAQEKTISGMVTDDTGLPLPGVNVVVKNTNNGTQTDFDGKYTITANQGELLVFSYIGFADATRMVREATTIDVQMTQSAAELEEVVVVGYGTSTKQAFTGTATAIKSENLEAKSLPNISQALTGEVAGVTVLNTSGQPGNVSTVRIRGFGSVNGNREPLYVVDGVPLTVQRDPNNQDNASAADFDFTISPLNSINPQDIESTTVLKDATATAIYGARGANGVILITTKKGRTGESTIEVDLKTGVNVQLIPRYDVVTSPEEFIGYAWEGIFNRGVGEGEADPVAYANARLFSGSYIAPTYNMWNVAGAAELIDPATRTVRDGVTRRYTPLSFRDLSFRTGFRREGNIRFSGGNEKTKYFASAGYLDDEGFAINTGFERINTRLNLTTQVKKWLKVGSNISYTFSENIQNGQTVGSENLFEFADKNPPIFPVFIRDENGNRVPDPIFGGFIYDYGAANAAPFNIPRTSANLLNPIGSARYDFLGSKRHDVIGNFNAEITFTEGLTLEAKYGLQYAQDRRKSYSNPFYGSEISSGGTLFQRDHQDITQNFLQLLRYNKSFDLHTINFLVAHESNEYVRQRNTAAKREAAIPGLLELNNFVVPQGPPTGFSEGASIESYFSQLNYNYKDTYYLSASIRRDGSSRFINEKWGTFGSVGASWIASNENFMANSSVLTFLKLKASYGIIGDQDGVDFFQSADTFTINNLNDNVSLTQRINGNPDLTWETSKMTQVGAEMSFNRYVDLDLDYYIKNTDNLFFNRRVGSSQGISSILVNDGVLQNRGLEFNLTAHLLKTDKASLDFTINGEHINNEIKEMPLEPSTGEPRIIDTSPAFYGYSQGSSIFDFFLREWAGVDPATGIGQWYQYYDDANGNGTLDSGEEFSVNLVQYLNDNPDANIQRQTTTRFSDATLKYVGKSSIPTVRGAFRLAGQYKNFSLTTQFTYSLGGWAFDAQYSELMNDRFGAGANNFHKDIRTRWQQPGDITNVPRISDNFDPNVGSNSTRWLIRSDFVALNNVQLGYSLPSKFLEGTGIGNINLWISGDNLFVASKRKGFNPQTSETGNTGRRLYAPLSTLNFGARVKF